MSEDSNAIKAVLVGETGVGKTCIIERLCFNKYTNNPAATLGAANVEKILDYGKEKLVLDIWDTAGQETYRSLNRIFYKNAKIVVLVYDITRKQTFDEIENYWCNQVRSICGEEAVIGIAGNKCDLYAKEQISEEVVKKFAEDNNCIFKQTSALNNIGVEELFMELGKKFLQDPNLVIKKDNNFQINKNNGTNNDGKEPKKCCK